MSHKAQTWRVGGFIVGNALPTKSIEITGVTIAPIETAEHRMWLIGPELQLKYPDNIWPGLAVLSATKKVVSDHQIYCDVELEGVAETEAADVARDRVEPKIRRVTTALSVASPEQYRYSYQITRVVLLPLPKGDGSMWSAWAMFRPYGPPTELQTEVLKNVRRLAKRADTTLENACKHFENGQVTQEFASTDTDLASAFLHYFHAIELIANKLSAAWRSDIGAEIEAQQIKATDDLESKLANVTGSARIQQVRRTAKYLDEIAEFFMKAKLERTFEMLAIDNPNITIEALVGIRNTLAHAHDDEVKSSKARIAIDKIDPLARLVINKYDRWLNRSKHDTK